MAAPSLFRLLLIPMTTVVILLTVVLTFWAGKAAKRPLLEDQVRALFGLAEQVSSQLDQALAERMYDIQSLISVSQFQQPSSRWVRQREYLNELSAAFPAYAWIGFADESGYVQVATGGLLEGEYVGARPWFQSGKSGLTTQDLHQAVLLGRLISQDNSELLRFVDVAAPVYAEDERLVGVLGAHLYEDWVKLILLAVIRPIEEKFKVEVVVFNSRHEVVIGDRTVVDGGNKLASVDMLQNEESAFVREAWRDGDRGLTVFTKTDGFANFPSLNWTVLLHRPDRELLRSARQLQLQMVIAGLTCALVFTLILAFILRRRLAPLQSLARDLRRVLDVEDLRRLDHGTGVAEVALIEDNLKDLAARLYVNQSELKRALDDRKADREEMHNLRLHAENDPLTKTLNRRGLDRRLAHFVEERESQAFQIAAILCDIDHFKQINDRYGHAAGDEVLKRFASILKDLIRDQDYLIRTGGEEFLILLVDTSLEEAEAMAHRLRANVEAGHFDIKNDSIVVTASFGVAGKSGHQSVDISTLLEIADERMYQAKRSGRNRVVVHS